MVYFERAATVCKDSHRWVSPSVPRQGLRKTKSSFSVKGVRETPPQISARRLRRPGRSSPVARREPRGFGGVSAGPHRDSGVRGERPLFFQVNRHHPQPRAGLGRPHRDGRRGGNRDAGGCCRGRNVRARKGGWSGRPQASGAAEGHGARSEPSRVKVGPSERGQKRFGSRPATPGFDYSCVRRRPGPLAPPPEVNQTVPYLDRGGGRRGVVLQGESQGFARKSRIAHVTLKVFS